MPESSAVDLMYRNLRVLQAASQEAEPLIRALGLESKEFLLLSQLDACPYPADLARQLMLPKPSITFLVKRMEAGRYLTRETQPGDLRRFRLTLTRKGRQAVEQARAILNEAYGRRLEKLTRAELKTFAHLLDKMG